MIDFDRFSIKSITKIECYSKEDNGKMFLNYKPYRAYYELLKEPDDMTDEEKVRLEKIRKIDSNVFGLMVKRAEQIREQIMALEKERDAIMNFLNGEERE